MSTSQGCWRKALVTAGLSEKARTGCEAAAGAGKAPPVLVLLEEAQVLWWHPATTCWTWEEAE